jgi:hypothetical protein
MGNRKTEVVKASPYTPAQAPINQGLVDAQKLYNQGGFQIDPYSGDMVANLTRDQLRANQMTRAAVPGQLANIQGAQDVVRGVQQQGYYGGFQDAVGNVQNAQETDDFRAGINAAQDTSFSNDYSQAASANLNTGVDSRLTSSVANAQNTSFDPRLNQGLNAAQNTSFDTQFDAVTGQPRGNDARFDRTVSREMNPGQSVQMSDAMRRSIIEGIAPQISGTFSKSGMANSGLHATNLARGLTSGLAPVEYQMEADNRNRALQAAGMAQSAYESGANYDLNAGQSRQSALDDGRNRSLAAGQAAQGATERGRSLSLSAGQAANAAQEAALARQFNVGTTSQGYLDAGRSRSLAAGQASEVANQDRLAAALQASQAGQSQMDANEAQALQAAGMMPALNAAYYDPINQLRDVGQYEQTQRQNEINAKIMRDQQQKNASASAIERYLALTSGVGGQFGTSTGTKTTNPGLLSTMGTMAQIASLSDIRAKEDITRVGTMDNGLPIYTYRYKDGNQFHMGVMAQEVQEVIPNAVSTRDDGMLQVHYERLI